MSFNSKKFWTEGFGSLFLAVLAALTVRWAILEAYIIPSESMLPTLLVNDHIFVNKWTYGVRVPFSERWLVRFSKPEQGDVIVFKYPKNKDIFYVKRIVGLPGDKVYYDKSGFIYVNNKKVSQISASSKFDFDFSWLRSRDFPEGSAYQNIYLFKAEKVGLKEYPILEKKEHYRRSVSVGPLTVPEGSYFVMGDNRGNSFDSRFWSQEFRFVPEGYVLGRASMVWLSCTDKLPIITFLCNPVKLRWSRFFHFID